MSLDLNEEEMDFESMSEEQLESFINSGGQAEPESNNPTESKEEIVNEEKEVVNEEVSEPEAEEPEEVDQDEQEEEEETESKESKFYSGKSREDLIKMVEENNRHISRQGNEIGELRKLREDMNSLKEQVATPKKAEDDFLAQYDKKDIDAIEKILDRREQQKQNQVKQMIQYNKRQNELDYQELQSNKELFEKVVPILDEKFASMGKNEEERIRNSLENDPGWVKKAIFESMTKLTSGKPKIKKSSNQSLKDKKSKASSINKTKSASTNTMKYKSEPEDPNEYLEYMRERGINIGKF